jgi:hypothetical protein
VGKSRNRHKRDHVSAAEGAGSITTGANGASIVASAFPRLRAAR